MTRHTSILLIVLLAGCVTAELPSSPDMADEQAPDMPVDMLNVVDMSDDLDAAQDANMLDMLPEDMADQDMPDLFDMTPVDMQRDMSQDMLTDLAIGLEDMSDLPEDMGPCGGACLAREVCQDDQCVDACVVQSAQCGVVSHDGMNVACGECAAPQEGCVANQCEDLCAAAQAECGEVQWSGHIASCGTCADVGTQCSYNLCHQAGEWSRVAAGRAHTCAVKQDGSTWCWGSNAQGQLGAPQAGVSSNVPVQTLNLSDVHAIDSSDEHTCVVDAAGLAWCWGDNTFGQVGNGQFSDRTAPYRISSLSDVIEVSAASWHTCARLSSGDVKCVGYGQQGQIGDGSTNNSTAFRAVRSSDQSVSLDTGTAHTCSVTLQGRVECWGFNGQADAYGRLGTGDTLSRVVPELIGDFGVVHQLASGEEHTCAVTQLGELWCWGDNTFGQLGDGTATDRLVPQKVAGLADVKRVDAGQSHTCAITHAGELWCWGRNASGQLGIDSINVQRTPQRVTALTEPVLDVSLGFLHTCAVTQLGELWCWGRNDVGQLGVGDQSGRRVPVEID